jgi:TIR domain/SIR2-like domain
MSVFISYSRRDANAVTSLHADIERAGHQAWFDREVEGGQLWWEVILERIRTSDLFVFVASPDAMASKACRAELAYAVGVHRPLLAVMVRGVNAELLPDPVRATQVVDFCKRTPESVMALTLALTHAPAPPPLPDPLPVPPAAPVGSLGPCREQVAVDGLSYEAQVVLVSELRRHADNGDEREAVVELLHQLRARPDVVESVADDIDALLARLPLATPGEDDEGEPGGGGKDVYRGDSTDLLRSLMTHLTTGHVTPILGLGMTDSLVGSRRELAREWARSFEFPVGGRDREDLAHVAQFVAVMSDQGTLRAGLSRYLRDEIQRRHPELAAVHPGVGAGELLRLAWDQRRVTTPADPHMVVASLPCSIFVNAHPANLLTDALRASGKDPQVEICRWRPEVYEWPASPFEVDPDYLPDVQRPLVYHVFGNVDAPDSLVLTEDDYLGHLVAVTEDKTLIPLAVRRALADSSLLLLGLGLEDWDARILLLSLVSQEGALKLQRYTHIAAQVAPGRDLASPARARRYLERYFSKVRRPAIDIYWGSVDEFVADLVETREPAR